VFCYKEHRGFTKGALGWVGRGRGAGKGTELVAAGGVGAGLVNQLPGIVGMQLILLNGWA